MLPCQLKVTLQKKSVRQLIDVQLIYIFGQFREQSTLKDRDLVNLIQTTNMASTHTRHF